MGQTEASCVFLGFLPLSRPRSQAQGCRVGSKGNFSTGTRARRSHGREDGQPAARHGWEPALTTWSLSATESNPGLSPEGREQVFPSHPDGLSGKADRGGGNLLGPWVPLVSPADSRVSHAEADSTGCWCGELQLGPVDSEAPKAGPTFCMAQGTSCRWLFLCMTSCDFQSKPRPQSPQK